MEEERGALKDNALQNNKTNWLLVCNIDSIEIHFITQLLNGIIKAKVSDDLLVA